MPVVYIPVQMRDLTGGVDRVEVAEGTLRQAIAHVEGLYPSLVGRLRDSQGIVPGLAVSVDGAFSSKGLLARLGPASEVHFLPAIGGG